MAYVPSYVWIAVGWLNHKAATADEQAAVVLYAAVGVALSVAWLGLHHHRNRHRDLLWAHVPSRFFAVERGRAVAGSTGYALVGGLVSVPVALAVFLLLPAGYALSSSGFHDLRRWPHRSR